ncbi:hypothetical protein [Pararhizobium sp.]|uniref:hypothetical protein n=1 Tax=Pararhizobium sp. TaxID=1977563 RepID=UPI00271BAC76|nr:hypothetical protein [Pararhizobium sp.]MDO9418876.1 hypothetical protein [Pararhizobium sp.]
MSEFRLTYPACVLAGKTRLTQTDVASLRDDIFAGGITSSADATALLAINASVLDICQEWRDYFLEAMKHFVVRYCYPQGAMDALNAEWLTAMISTNGVIRTQLEFDLLIRVMAESAFVPDRLIVLAIDQIRAAISDDAGAWAERRPRSGPAVKAEDMALIHQVLRYGEGRRMVPVPVAAALKRTDALCSTQALPPGWTQLMRGIKVLDGSSTKPAEEAQSAAA